MCGRMASTSHALTSTIMTRPKILRHASGSGFHGYPLLPKRLCGPAWGVSGPVQLVWKAGRGEPAA